MSSTGIPYWIDSLGTGIEEIDAQHRVLLATLSEVEAEAGTDSSHARLAQITRDLLAYAIYHFETEERLFVESGYDLAESAVAAAHIAEHRGFSQRVLRMRAADAEGHQLDAGELLSFLRSWLLNHIATVDQDFGRFVIAREQRRAASAGRGTPVP